MLYEVGWRVMECHRIREGICPCVGDASRTVYGGESNVVQNNVTILRFVRITHRHWRCIMNHLCVTRVRALASHIYAVHDPSIMHSDFR
jgi:hypothetical protein